MNTQKIKLAVFSICGLMLFPFATYAGSAIQITDTTALFSVNFSFTDDIFDLEIPIAAKHGVAITDKVDYVGYTLTDADGETLKPAQVNAVVLSQQPVNETRYDLSANTTGLFSLFILATFDEAITEDVTATITKVPYYLDDRRTSVHQTQLDEISAATLAIE